MIDTEATVNIIKRGSLKPHIPIIEHEQLYLSRITKTRVCTLGSTNVKWAGGHAVVFQVVPNEFSIKQDSILGLEFLRDRININILKQCLEWQGIQMPFTTCETTIVPARSRATLYLIIGNAQLKISYVQRLDLDDGIFAGDAVVSNLNEKARIKNSSTMCPSSRNRGNIQGGP